MKRFDIRFFSYFDMKEGKGKILPPPCDPNGCQFWKKIMIFKNNISIGENVHAVSSKTWLVFS